MKKTLIYFKFIAISILIVLVTYKTWEYIHDKNFVKNNFVTYTGIREYVVKGEYFDNHKSYIEAVITHRDKQKLLEKFKFEPDLQKLKGRVECEFISESKMYDYYTIEDGYGPYGYILFAMEKEGNTLKVYEEYGN